MKQLFRALPALGLFTLATPVSAAVQWEDTGCVQDGAATISCIEPLFANIIYAVVSISAVILFIMLVIGGFKFMIASGDPKNLDTAKKTITYALLGLFVIVCSYLILRTLEAFTGVTLTTFSVQISP